MGLFLSMILPAYLQKGDKVAIVAPAKKVAAEEILPAKKILQQWGLQIIEGQNLYEQDNYFAGTDQQRLADLQCAFDAPEIKAILCARGGYGTTRILEQLNWQKFKRYPKWIVGFSDLTALQTHAITENCASIHGPMAFNFAKMQNTEAIAHLKNILFGQLAAINIPQNPFNKSSEAEGIIIGGNLSILTNVIGTASDIKYDQRILLIEEIEEYYYRIDRMMIQLKRAGKLDHLSALVVGQFTNMMDNQIPYGKNAYQIIKETVADYDYPVFFDASFGHIKDNYAFPQGVPGKIVNENKNWKLTYTTL